MNQFLLAIFILVSFTNCKSIHQRKDTVTNQLEALKSGVLLVRLPTNKAKFAKLKELGKYDKAKKESIYMQQFHIDVMSSFERYFKYSPVYFYYSDASLAVKAGDYDGNLFDAKRKNIASLPFDKEHIFYAEFGTVYQDEIVKKQDGEIIKVAGLEGSKALVIRTKDGIQPPRPFPYAVPCRKMSSRKIQKAVIKLNQRLFAVQRKMKQRKIRQKRKDNG